MKIAGWNVARGLSDVGREPQIIEGIRRIDADIIILSEAFDKTGVPVNPDFGKELGYEVFLTEYEDQEPHPSEKQYIVALSRVAVEATVLRLATRNTLSLMIENQGRVARLVGAHFDDRNEVNRQAMAESLIQQVDLSQPTLLVGDLNSMHGGNTCSKLLRNPFVQSMAQVIPLSRPRSLATRLTEMADGGTQEIFKEAGFDDADSSRRPTMLFLGIGIVQLDHILHTDRIRSDNFQIHQLPGSDHRAIFADISFIE